MTLYSLNGAEPGPLPFTDMFDPEGRLWVDIANSPDGLAACGYKVEPDRPAHDPALQVVTWSDGAWVVSPIPPQPLADLKAAAVAAAQAQFGERVAAGFMHNGHPVQLDGESQTVLTAIGATAIAASSSVVPWPPGYARGWIAADGVRIPLPTPTEGLTFSAAVGAYFSLLVQHEQDLEDAINAAADAAAVAAVDVTAGWPA